MSRRVVKARLPSGLVYVLLAAVCWLWFYGCWNYLDLSIADESSLDLVWCPVTAVLYAGLGLLGVHGELAMDLMYLLAMLATSIALYWALGPLFPRLLRYALACCWLASDVVLQDGSDGSVIRSGPLRVALE